MIAIGGGALGAVIGRSVTFFREAMPTFDWGLPFRDSGDPALPYTISAITIAFGVGWYIKIFLDEYFFFSRRPPNGFGAAIGIFLTLLLFSLVTTVIFSGFEPPDERKGVAIFLLLTVLAMWSFFYGCRLILFDADLKNYEFTKPIIYFFPSRIREESKKDDYSWAVTRQFYAFIFSLFYVLLWYLILQTSPSGFCLMILGVMLAVVFIIDCFCARTFELNVDAEPEGFASYHISVDSRVDENMKIVIPKSFLATCKPGDDLEVQDHGDHVRVQKK